MPRPKRRRRKRSTLLPTLLLFGLGLGCLITAGVMWLWSPDNAAHPAASPEPVAVRVAEPPPVVTPPPAPPPTRAPLEPTVAPASQPVATAMPSAPPTAGALPLAEASPSGRPRLAIIIDDCGQWPTTERGFLALPFPVTLSVLPHVRYGPEIARAAESAGKGVMLHLPMQTLSGRYPGPGTITTAMSDDAIRSEVSGDLEELPEARGVNNHEGSRATADRRVMDDVADVLVRDKVFWIDSRTSAASVAFAVARSRGVPAASRDVFLDDVDSLDAVEAQLREAAARARESGSAIAIGHPRAATLLAVQTLGPSLAAGGIDLTLASDLVH